MKKHIYWILLTFLALGCAKTEQPEPEVFEYKTRVFGASGSQQLVLDKFPSQISSLESNVSWLSAAIGETTPQGYPTLVILSKDGAEGKGLITVTADNGNKALVTVFHSPIWENGDDLSMDPFTMNWWDFETVSLQGISAPQRTPWTVEGGVTIPTAIRLQYKPEHGWEMAFCYLNDDTMEGVRFFALYNKWTGQMRVYTYIQNPTGWGSDIAFRTYMGELNDNDMYPLYNMFQYGIPSRHVPGESLQRISHFVDKQSQTFMSWISPYMQSSSLSPGWYVFEFDMSGFVPEGKDWLKADVNQAKFKFFAETQDNKAMTLKGSLTGKLSGSFQNEQVVQTGGTSALHGISNALGMLSGMTTSSVTNAAQYAMVMELDKGIGQYLNPMKYYGGFALQFGAGLLGWLADEADPVSYDTIPGKIDLSLDATLELNGYISGYTSNNFKPLAVSTDAIVKANGEDGHVGKGVWGLADDPVVYIDKDVLMSDEPYVRIVNRGGGKYSQPNFDDYGLRLVWLYDPASIKVNINRDLFPVIDSVHVTTTCGVYTNKPYGNTDPYRTTLMLANRPSFDISGGTGEGKLIRLDESSAVRLKVVKREELLDTEEKAYETAAGSTLVDQPGGHLHFFGRVITDCDKNIIVDPQVYVPYARQDDTFIIENPTAPDFVVTVNVVFASQGSTYLYTKCFIPRIELVDHQTMLGKYAELQQFAAKCSKNETTATLANDSSVNVYNPGGDQLLAKSFRMMEKVK